MIKVTVKQTRERLRHYIDMAEQGEQIVVSRRGRPVVRLVPMSVTCEPLPPLEEFRRTIARGGSPLSECVINSRRDERY